MNELDGLQLQGLHNSSLDCFCELKLEIEMEIEYQMVGGQTTQYDT